MKKVSLAACLRTFSFAAMLFFMQVIAFAQDSASTGSSTKTVTTHTETTEWYAEPWVWVVGVIVLILVLIGLFRGKSSTTDVNVTKVNDRS